MCKDPQTSAVNCPEAIKNHRKLPANIWEGIFPVTAGCPFIIHGDFHEYVPIVIATSFVVLCAVMCKQIYILALSTSTIYVPQTAWSMQINNVNYLNIIRNLICCKIYMKSYNCFKHYIKILQYMCNAKLQFFLLNKIWFNIKHISIFYIYNYVKYDLDACKDNARLQCSVKIK